jgi:hypothetical protein
LNKKRPPRLLALLLMFILLPIETTSHADKVDKCLFLNGSSHLEFNESLVNVEGAFTVEFWFNQSATSVTPTEIISQGSQPYAFYIGPTNNNVFRAGDGWLDTKFNSVERKWTHVALTRTSTGVGKFYINGQLVASNNDYLTKNGRWPTRLGAQFGLAPSEHFYGCLDELRIWNYTRDANQINSGLNKGSVTTAPGLFYWDMDSEEITHIADDTGLKSRVKYQKFGVPAFVKVFGESYDESSDNSLLNKLIDHPFCSELKIAPCIESLDLIDRTGAVIKGIPINPLKINKSFAYLTTGLVETYQWRTPGVSHENGTEILDLSVYRFPFGASYCWALGQCQQDVDEIVIFINGDSRVKPSKKVEFSDLPTSKICGGETGPGYCYVRWGINTDYRYRVTLLTEREFDFSHSNGEAREGSLNVTELASGDKRLVFSGYPIAYNAVIESSLRPVFNRDKADYSTSYIGVYAHSTKSQQSQWLSRCNYGRGMSLWYSGKLESMPTWLASESALTLQVSSTHLKPDGSKNLGTFNIEMPIVTAQCLWGVDLSKAARAVISTVYPEIGESEIVTTSAVLEDGYYKINASGFHFSSPTIKVRLTQVPSIANTESSSTSNSNIPKSTNPPKTVVKEGMKKVTITCVNGKIQKKVTATNPKCPRGLKKR